MAYGTAGFLAFYAWPRNSLRLTKSYKSKIMLEYSSSFGDAVQSIVWQRTYIYLRWAGTF